MSSAKYFKVVITLNPNRPLDLINSRENGVCISHHVVLLYELVLCYLEINFAISETIGTSTTTNLQLNEEDTYRGKQRTDYMAPHNLVFCFTGILECKREPYVCLLSNQREGRKATN